MCDSNGCFKSTHNDSDGLAMTDKVHFRLPTVSFDNLSRRTRVVHCVSRDDVLAIRGPVETKDVSSAIALNKTNRDSGWLLVRFELANFGRCYPAVIVMLILVSEKLNTNSSQVSQQLR